MNKFDEIYFNNIPSNQSENLLVEFRNIKNNFQSTNLDIKKTIEVINKIMTYENSHYRISSSSAELFFKENEKEIPITNTLLIPISEKTIHSLNSKHRELQVICIRDGIVLGEISIKPNELISQGLWIKEKLGFKSRLYFGVGAYQHIVEFIQILCKYMIEVNEFAHIVWAKALKGVFITGQDVIGSVSKDTEFSAHPQLQDFKLTTLNISEKEAFKFMRKIIFKVAPINVTYSAVSYQFLSILSSVLKEWTYKPEFIYYLWGESGSRKTSMSKIFFNIYEKYLDSVPINFTSTQPAMEELLVSFRDCVCLIDDIAPSTNNSEKQAIEKKLEAIVRAYGDSIGRQKMSSNREKVEMKPQGLVAITAEDNVVKSSSSMARCFIVRIAKDKVNLEKLTEAQNNRLSYPTAIKYYIEYISANFDTFIEKFKKNFLYNYKLLMEKFQNTHGRTIMSAAWLHSSFSSYIKYGLEKEYISKSKAEEYITENSRMLNMMIKEQTQLVKQDNEIDLFVNGLKELLSTHKIRIPEVRLYGRRKTVELDYTDKGIIGFCDVENIYLFKDTSYAAVLSFYSKQKITFPVTLKSLLDGLYRKKLLKPDNNKDGTKTIRVTINGQRLSVIRLDRDKFEAWDEKPYEIYEDEIMSSNLSINYNA